MGAVSKQGRVEAERPTERPTIRPPFDPEEFARESESGLHATAPTSPPPTPRVMTRPEAPSLELTPSRSTRSPSPPDAPEIEQPSTVVDVDGSDALSALGLHAVPVLGVSRDELEWVVLSADADRLLAFIDGARTLEAVAAMAKTSAEEVATLLLELADQGLVSFLG